MRQPQGAVACSANLLPHPLCPLSPGPLAFDHTHTDHTQTHIQNQPTCLFLLLPCPPPAHPQKHCAWDFYPHASLPCPPAPLPAPVNLAPSPLVPPPLLAQLGGVPGRARPLPLPRARDAARGHAAPGGLRCPAPRSGLGSGPHLLLLAGCIPVRLQQRARRGGWRRRRWGGPGDGRGRGGRGLCGVVASVCGPAGRRGGPVAVRGAVLRRPPQGPAGILPGRWRRWWRCW